VQLRHRAAGIGRFRVSAFVQQGAVGCVNPMINRERSPVSKSSTCRHPQGSRAVKARPRDSRGRHRLGQVNLARGDGGLRNEKTPCHIVTIEDPIEYVHQHKGCSSRTVRWEWDTDSWHTALKNTLRQAPDVILIGEIRDRETNGVRHPVAGDGHLVLRNSAREQRQQGARPRHQLLPRRAAANSSSWICR